MEEQNVEVAFATRDRAWARRRVTTVTKCCHGAHLLEATIVCSSQRPRERPYAPGRAQKTSVAPIRATMKPGKQRGQEA